MIDIDTTPLTKYRIAMDHNPRFYPPLLKRQSVKNICNYSAYQKLLLGSAYIQRVFPKRFAYFIHTKA
jgi:hypothetical protein